MSNVVKQVPSQDDEFFNFTYRLIRHSRRRMFSYIMKHLTATEWGTKLPAVPQAILGTFAVAGRCCRGYYCAEIRCYQHNIVT